MATSSTNRERRDWTLIIFLLPIGILLMLLAGQIAIRLVPSWSVDAGMQSSLDPESASGQQSGLIPVISFNVMTPMSWFDSYLTPGIDSGNDGISFAPFIILEPSLTPSPTISVTATDTPVTPTATATTTTPTWTPTTKPPDDDDTPTPPAPTTCTDPAATNFGGPLPCTYPPTTCTDPLANNNGGPLPCIYPVTSTPEGTLVTATPTGFNVGPPDGAPIGNVPDGTYFVVDLSGNPITVSGSFETNYDFVYYERDTGTDVDMDQVILSISSDGSTYYVVFNWSDGVPDNNSNVGDVAGAENDNQSIPYSELHNNTGILVDVDNAPSNPPVATYEWLAIQAPGPPPGDGADVDSIEVTEVPP